MSKEIEIIELKLDYDQGPIWVSDPEDGTPCTCVDVIDNDEELRKINYEISCMYTGYYEFGEGGYPVTFNEEKYQEESSIMLELMNKLNKRLNEINDGSFEVVDYITPALIENIESNKK